MTLDQLKAFLAKAKGDQSIQDKLKAAMSPDDVVSIANDHGHEFSADQISQLSEEDLEGMSGGTCMILPGGKAMTGVKPPVV